jgi:hypothetical protein
MSSRKFQKFAYSARTGKYQGGSYAAKLREHGLSVNYPAKLREHRKGVLATVEALKKENIGKSIKILEVRPVPDILMVDWGQKKIIAVEFSRSNQLSEKKVSYESYDAWDRVMLLKGDEKKRECSGLRFRRIFSR